MLFLSSGCAVGPNYKRPQVNAPATFRGETQAAATNSIADLPWWEIFQDDALRELIRAALTNSYDLRIAVTRVEQARALAAQSRADFFPQLNYSAGAGRNRNAANGVAVFDEGQTASFFKAAGDVSWEIDLWGRIRRLSESARAQFFASEEARRDVMISVIGDVAEAYFQLIALDVQLEISKRATNAFGESLKIFTERLQGGVASRLETSSAEAALASAAATIPDLERRIALQENQINVLLGRNPGPIPRNDSLLRTNFSLPEVPAGLPSALLERRPDIRQAEELFRSANARVGVALANFFPNLSLTALFGHVSPELSAFTSGGANAWSAAANLAGPIFQGGRLAAQYREAKATREQFWLQYQATVLNAFREVSDALISRQKFADARVQQARAVAAYEEAVEVAVDRYRVGQSSYYEVLQEQQQLFPTQNALVQTRLN
ncbi:MAG TPA: efflux transporter outer membrane subunit, partial [Candidatus Limnocylindria bacterium]|nr:efflux transporter outer membrane subunit [Candidatus Limnocylindria bacterium]